MSVVARLEEQAVRPEMELRGLLTDAQGEGAVVSFVGVARSLSKSGGSLKALVLEAHPVLTERSLVEIASDAKRRFAVSHVRVVHRCGHVPAGEAILFAGAAAIHRRAAFDAADYMMDRLKTEAIFWKREVGDSGSEWIEPTAIDYSDRERWG